MPPVLALYAKQFLEIKLFTFDYHENKSQRTVDYDVLLDQRFIVRRSSPLMQIVWYPEWLIVNISAFFLSACLPPSHASVLFQKVRDINHQPFSITVTG